MADALDDVRTAGEADLEDRLAKLNVRHQKLIRSELRKHGSIAAIPLSIWVDIEQEIETESAAALLLIMLAADEVTSGRILRKGVPTTGVDAGTLAAYGRTAGDKAQVLAQQTTRSKLDGLLQAEVGAAQPDKPSVDTQIKTLFKPDKAQDAAVTSTTDSISDGQLGSRDRVQRQQGIEVKLKWITEKDDRVCPICRPLHGTFEPVWSQTSFDGPPAHPRCRCHLEPTPVKTRRQTPIDFRVTATPVVVGIAPPL